MPSSANFACASTARFTSEPVAIKIPAEYKESVLPKAVTKRVAIEAAASFGWERYVGTEGKTITIDHFGASAPGGLVLEKFGFTPENVVNTYKSL